MTQVLPAIIPHTKEQLEQEMKVVAKFAPVVQIDISDGTFSKNISWPYNGRDVDFFEKLKKEEEGWPMWDNVDIELHLMIKNPEDSVLDWIKTGATGIVAQIEESRDFQKFINICREHSVSVGVAIKPSTDISKIESFLSHIDFVQVMGSDLLGKHGVELDPRAIEHIKTLRRRDSKCIIAIDIGVNTDTVESLVEAGANKLISGSAILGAASPESVYRVLDGLQ